MRALRVILLSSIVAGLIYYRLYTVSAFVLPFAGWYIADLCLGKEYRWMK